MAQCYLFGMDGRKEGREADREERSRRKNDFPRVLSFFPSQAFYGLSVKGEGLPGSFQVC